MFAEEITEKILRKNSKNSVRSVASLRKVS